MGVYIPDMEMPKNEPLLVKINPDGSVSTTAKNGYKKYEAVHIPPHGRLIDADALMHDTDSFVHKTMLFGGQYVYSEDAIKNAPTIIPADDGGGG